MAKQGQLADDIKREFNSDAAMCPSEWISEIEDVHQTLREGADTFVNWRYGLVEHGEVRNGFPTGLFVIGKGIELLCRRRLGQLPS